jgi:cathepsin A (carboxypeptidase C)
MKSFLLCFALVVAASCRLFSVPLEHELLRDHNPIFLNESYYAGFQPLDTRGSLFYWLFESRSDPSSDPLVVWLTGGPGCSSELAIFTENGPFKIDKDTNTLKSHPYSWNNIANVLYVDQPLGTGFSTGSRLDTSEEQIAVDFYTFLQEFLKTYPQYENRDFFITGESYAGHYIPSISTYIIKTKGLNLNFKGVAIGDGLMSVYWQFPQYATFALENNLVDQQTYETLKKGYAVCDSLIQKGLINLAMAECNRVTDLIVGNPPKFNVYDIRLPCEGPLCYDMSYVDDFLEQKKVEKALGVSGRPWAECNDTVGEYLGNDLMTDLTADVGFLITSGLEVVLYHGDKDFICNWRGGEAVANNVQWSGQGQFVGLPYTKWENYGEFKHLDNFTFYRIYNAGHLVPMDQPAAALAMLARVIKGW